MGCVPRFSSPPCVCASSGCSESTCMDPSCGRDSKAFRGSSLYRWGLFLCDGFGFVVARTFGRAHEGRQVICNSLKFLEEGWSGIGVGLPLERPSDHAGCLLAAVQQASLWGELRQGWYLGLSMAWGYVSGNLSWKH